MSAAIPHLSPMSAFGYAKYIAKRRIPECEDQIATDASLAWDYYRDIMRHDGEWKAAEPVFAKDPEQAVQYASSIQKPFPLGEEAIKKDAECSSSYARWVLKAPWPEGEQAIREGWVTKRYGQHGCWIALHYIEYVLIPAGETDFTRFYEIMQSNPPTWDNFVTLMKDVGPV